MNNIRTVQAIADKIAKGQRDGFGNVALKESGDYILLNYTHAAQYSGAFTAVERACRGLVVRTDGKIMALPMEKFFNVGEPQCPTLPDEPYQIFEKIDGSLGIFWHDGDDWRCNTRGSFDNEYTAFAAPYWHSRIHSMDLPKHWTVMVEICMDDDENPRAVQHEAGLYLIAVRDNYSGADISITSKKAERWLPYYLRRARLLTYETVDTLLEKKAKTEGTEGWVVRFDSGLRVKVKTAWYLRIFRAMQAMTPRRIREMMVEAGENWIDEFPDDLRPEAIEIQEAIEAQFRVQLKRVYDAYGKVAGIETRKDYALAVLADYGDISSWLFNLRDNKFDEMEMLRRMDLEPQ